MFFATGVGGAMIGAPDPLAAFRPNCSSRDPCHHDNDGNNLVCEQPEAKWKVNFLECCVCGWVDGWWWGQGGRRMKMR